MSILLRGLTKEYERGGAVFRAEDQANLTVGSSEFVNIVGRSGSGKSTLLNLITGLMKPTAGTIEIDGRDISRWSDRAVSSFRNEKIGYLAQGQSLLAGLSVLDNIRLPCHLFANGGDSAERALLLLKKVGCFHLREAYPKYLSGGEAKRVAIARALVNRPSYVIADEPTGDLDPRTARDIMELFQDVAEEGTAVLMVTHELNALHYGTRTLVMDAGVLTERTVTADAYRRELGL